MNTHTHVPCKALPASSCEYVLRSRMQWVRKLFFSFLTAIIASRAQKVNISKSLRNVTSRTATQERFVIKQENKTTFIKAIDWLMPALPAPADPSSCQKGYHHITTGSTVSGALKGPQTQGGKLVFGSKLYLTEKHITHIWKRWHLGNLDRSLGKTISLWTSASKRDTLQWNGSSGFWAYSEYQDRTILNTENLKGPAPYKHRMGTAQTF